MIATVDMAGLSTKDRVSYLNGVSQEVEALD